MVAKMAEGDALNRHSIRKLSLETLIVNEDLLSRIVTYLQNRQYNATLLVHTSDGFEDEFSALANVLELPNTLAAEIQTVQIKANNHNSYVHLSMHFPKSAGLNWYSFFVSVSGQQKNEVEIQFRDLLGILESFKRTRFYSIPARIPYWAGTFFVVSVLSIVLWLFVSTNTYESLPKSVGIGGTVYMVAVAVLLFPLVYLISRIFSYLFPPVEFLIGSGQRRHSERKTARTILSPVVFLLVSLAIGQLDTLIRSHTRFVS